MRRRSFSGGDAVGKAAVKAAFFGIYRLAHYHAKQATIDGVRLTLRRPEVSNAMFYKLLTGRYEHEERDLLRRHLTPSDRVLEIGAGIGFLCIYCMNRIGTKDYAIVESNPRLKTMILDNFALNGIDPARVTYIDRALAAHDGEVEFYVADDFWSSSLVERPIRKAAARVRGVTPEQVLSLAPFQPTALVMDIEGGETYIDFRPFRTVSKIVIELHPHIIGRPACDEVVQGLEALGFERKDERKEVVVLKRNRSSGGPQAAEDGRAEGQRGHDDLQRREPHRPVRGDGSGADLR